MYTEEQLKKAIKYACEYQKATDYQTAGSLLIEDTYPCSPKEIRLLDELANNITAHKQITLEDIGL